MSGSPKKKARRDRLTRMLESPDTLGSLMARVANGETLRAITLSLDVPFNAVRAWLFAEDERARAYSAALASCASAHEDAATQEIANMVEADLGAAFEENGSLKPLSKIPPGLRRWISALEVQTIQGPNGPVGTVTRLRLFDKPRVVELMLKKLNLLAERPPQEVSIAEVLALSFELPPGPSARERGVPSLPEVRQPLESARSVAELPENSDERT